MKKQIKKWMQAVLVLAPFVLPKPVQAQFTTAVIPETFVGVGASCGNTGNDIRKSITGLGVMSVNVWDGASAGLSWDDLAGTSGFLTFTSPTQDPDVTVLDGGSTWWACVAYFSPGTGYFLDIYKYGGGVFSLSSSNLLSGCTTPGLSINIDGDQTGDMVVVWDDPCVGRIMLLGASTFLTGPPVLCNGGVPIVVTNTGGMVYPDVTLYSIDGVRPQYGVVYLTYLRSNLKRIFVTYDKFTSICAGVSNNVLMFTNTTSLSYYTPRISCPPAATGTILDWSVVVTEVSGTGYDVLGFTRNAGTVLNFNYTNGTFILPVISQWNKYPAITYDGNYNGIILSWKSFYTGGGAGTFLAPAPVAIQCDVFGNYIGGAMCGNGYMIVPFFNFLTGAGEDAISNAGRDYADIMYTFCDNNFPDILWKTVPFTNCSLRSGESTSTAVRSKESLFPNPVKDNFTINIPSVKNDIHVQMQIVDMSGKPVIDFNGTINAINENAAVITSKLASGVYMMKLTTADKNYNFRMVKM